MVCFFKTKKIQFRSAITIRVYIEEKIEERIFAEDALYSLKSQQQCQKNPECSRLMMRRYQALFTELSGYFNEEPWLNRFEYLAYHYLLNSESLKQNLIQLTPRNLNNLKKALVALFIKYYRQFESRVAGETPENSDPDLYQERIKAFKMFYIQTKSLVLSARTVSGVIAAVAMAAELAYQQPEIAELSLNCVEECAPLLKDSLTMRPAVVEEEHGAAFKFEQFRELVIKKLESYLKTRAERIETQRSGNYFTQIYLPIDRGVFYNNRLQDARIELASKLLVQLQFMSENGKDIDSPKHLLQMVQKAKIENEHLYCLYGRIIDKQGDLAPLLDTMQGALKAAYGWQEDNLKRGSLQAIR